MSIFFGPFINHVTFGGVSTKKFLESFRWSRKGNMYSPEVGVVTTFLCEQVSNGMWSFGVLLYKCGSQRRRKQRRDRNSTEMHTGVSKEINKPGREARKRNVMESKPADILKYRKILVDEYDGKLLRKFGLRRWKIQCAWSGFLSELELVWSGFVRVLKYEEKVNSRKVWLGLWPKFFGNFSCETRIVVKTNWLCLRSKMFAKKWNSGSAIWPITVCTFQNYVFSEVYFGAGGTVCLRKDFS